MKLSPHNGINGLSHGVKWILWFCKIFSGWHSGLGKENYCSDCRFVHGVPSNLLSLLSDFSPCHVGIQMAKVRGGDSATMCSIAGVSALGIGPSRIIASINLMLLARIRGEMALLNSLESTSIRLKKSWNWFPAIGHGNYINSYITYLELFWYHDAIMNN